MRRETCATILASIFGFLHKSTSGESDQTTSALRHWDIFLDANPEGFHILCRPSQFARFIIRRHEAGECINGIRDLAPTLLSEWNDPSYEISRRIGVNLETVRAVLRAFDSDIVDDRVYIDVSNNF